MKRLILATIIFITLSLLTVPVSTAYFTDELVSSGNVFQAGEWDVCEVEIIAPNGGEEYVVGNPREQLLITWENNFLDPDFDAEANTYIKLWLSMDGGNKYVPAIKGNTKKDNLEYFIWNPHPVNDDDLKVKIAVYDDDGNLLCEDESDETFSVVPPAKKKK